MCFMKVKRRAAICHAECSKREVPISHLESARGKNVQKDAPSNLEKGAESERSNALISSPFVTKHVFRRFILFIYLRILLNYLIYFIN